MKIAYVSPTDATNVSNWSGLYLHIYNLHIYKSLEAQGLQIELMSDLDATRSVRRDLRKAWGAGGSGAPTTTFGMWTRPMLMLRMWKPDSKTLTPKW